jgi:hypothetical protein
MPAGRRDYILTLIDQIGEVLAQLVAKRKNTPQPAAAQSQQVLHSIIQSCERLFGLEASRLFQFTPDQHVVMLAEGESPENARDKILLYAALCAEAGQTYTVLGKPEPARHSFLNALRLTLKAKQTFGAEGLPLFAPDVSALLSALQDAPLDPETAELVRVCSSL